MDNRHRRKSLYYLDLILKSTIPVACLLCDSRLLPKYMGDHFKSCHPSYSTNWCLWCLDFTWKGNKITSVVNSHRLECFERVFVGTKQHKVTAAAATAASTSSDDEDIPLKRRRLVCAATTTTMKKSDLDSRDRRTELMEVERSLSIDSPLFDHDYVHKTGSYCCNSKEIDDWYSNRSRLRRNLFGNVSSSFNIPQDFVAPSDTEGLTVFSDFGDGKLPAWLTDEDGVDLADLPGFYNNFPMDPEMGFNPVWQRLFTFKRNLRWFSLQVRASHWTRFLEFMNGVKQMYILPYSCLCRHGAAGGDYHRHMICVIHEVKLKSFHSRFWRYISTESFIQLQPAENPMQLVNLISVYSNLKLTCSSSSSINDFYDDDGDYCNENESVHFYIFQPVVPFVRLFAMLYIPNGVDIYMRAKYNRILGNGSDYISLCYKYNDGWCVEYRDLAREKFLIFPLPKKVQISRRLASGVRDIKNNFLYLNDYLMVESHYNPDLPSMCTDEWNACQIQSGNCLLWNMNTQMYKFPEHQQHLFQSISTATLHQYMHIQELRAIIAEKDELLQTASDLENINCNDLIPICS